MKTLIVSRFVSLPHSLIEFNRFNVVDWQLCNVTIFVCLFCCCIFFFCANMCSSMTKTRCKCKSTCFVCFCSFFDRFIFYFYHALQFDCTFFVFDSRRDSLIFFVLFFATSSLHLISLTVNCASNQTTKMKKKMFFFSFIHCSHCNKTAQQHCVACIEMQ